MQLPDPAVLYAFIGQVVQDDAPAALEKPAAHTPQKVAPTSPENVPAAQLVQEEEPAMLRVPIAHRLQDAVLPVATVAPK